MHFLVDRGAEHRLAEGQHARDALRGLRPLQRRAEQHRAARRQVVGHLQRAQDDEAAETVADEMQLARSCCACAKSIRLRT